MARTKQLEQCLRHRLDDQGTADRLPRSYKRFFPFSQPPDRLWRPPGLLLNGYRGSFLGVKRIGRGVEHGLPTGAEVKNEWNYTSAPPICIHGVDRDNFTFFDRTLKIVIAVDLVTAIRRGTIPSYWTCNNPKLLHVQKSQVTARAKIPSYCTCKNTKLLHVQKSQVTARATIPSYCSWRGFSTLRQSWFRQTSYIPLVQNQY
jgi:hypothetical protein